MAVKVMVAPAIVNGQVREAKQLKRPMLAAGEKPRRRRSAVYDADGKEVFITLMCLKCHKTRPLVQFGLRRMADGAIRNQPWCRPCRSSAGLEKANETLEAIPQVPETGEGMGAEEQSLETRASPHLASEVAAALIAGAS